MTRRLATRGVLAMLFTVGCVVLFVLGARHPATELIPTTRWIDTIYVTPTNCLAYTAGYGTHRCEP